MREKKSEEGLTQRRRYVKEGLGGAQGGMRSRSQHKKKLVLWPAREG
jgi:hypothetical protein